MDKNQTIASIMTPKPLCIDAGFKLDQARRLMKAANVRQLLVTRFGELAGILTERNIKAKLETKGASALSAADIMDVGPYIVPPEMSIQSVLQDMLDFKLDYAVVAQDERTPLGIFTRQDALALLIGERRPGPRGALRLVASRRQGAVA